MSTSSAISHSRHGSSSSASSISSSADIVVFRGRRADVLDVQCEFEGYEPAEQILTDFNIYDNKVDMSDLVPADGTVLLETDDQEPAPLASPPSPPPAAERPSPAEDDVDSLYEDREEPKSKTLNSEANASHQSEATNTGPQTQQTSPGSACAGVSYEANFYEKPLTFTPPKELASLMTSPVMHIYFGKGRKHYKLPKKLACFHSYYFRGHCSTYEGQLNSHYDHQEDLHDLEDCPAFEAVKDYMMNHKIDVKASGLSLAEIMLRFLRVYTMVHKLDIVPTGDVGPNVYSTLHDHMNKLYEANGRVLSEEYIGLALEKLPANRCLVILQCVAQTLHANPRRHLSEEYIDLALTSLHVNHPTIFKYLRSMRKEEVTLNVDIDLNYEEQVELAIKRSLKEQARNTREETRRYRF